MKYIFVREGKLNGCGHCPVLDEGIINLEVTDYVYNAYSENPQKYIYSDGEVVENPDYDKEQAEKERERINMLYLTAADVERAIYKVKGMDFDDIVSLVETQPLSEDDKPSIDIKALKIELRANNFYRGNPYINTVGTLLGFSEKQMDEFFETNDYTKLLEE